MNDVKLIKLMNGEELIAKVKSEDEEFVTVDTPAIVMLSPGQNGNLSVQMGPYCPHTNNDIPLNRQHILYMVEPNTELLNGYSKAFGSGIVIPNQKLMG